MRRNVFDVIERVLAVVPEEEKAFRHELEKIASDRWNPPEALWHKGALVFFDRFGGEMHPTEGWSLRAFNIWMNLGDEADGVGAAVVDVDLAEEPGKQAGILDWLRGVFA